ncbi:MAG: diguanylate cyclase response regulator [Elusimicrobia bacterium]|nr:diguanylate cyclase response regulator [Candidatus Obscuribacterium magneticum]
MKDKPFEILLIEDNPDDALLLRESLIDAGFAFNMENVNRLSTGLSSLEDKKIDIVLLDLSLPDSQGLEGLIKIQNHTPNVPIVILTGLNDEQLAEEAVKKGAQDYLIKTHARGTSIIRVIRYAIDRAKLREEIRSLSLIDELTQLYNRRGFLTLAQHQLKITNRTKKFITLLFADVDGLKWINDTLGHQEGDKALIETANILKGIFRDSDIIARIGGDEFVILMTEPSNVIKNMLSSRFHNAIEKQIEARGNSYKLSISFGMAEYNPEHPISIEELLNKVDASMYEQKRKKKLSTTKGIGNSIIE